MRRIVALLVLTLSPFCVMAKPAQAVQSASNTETTTVVAAGDDTPDASDRPVTPRGTSTDTRARKANRAAPRGASRAQSFLPGMIR